MKRLYPTSVRVVENGELLDEVEESKKGYYDSKTNNKLYVGVSKNKYIYLYSPSNWYRSVTFKLIYTANTPSVQVDINGEEATIRKNDEFDAWRMVARVVKAECGRRVVVGKNKIEITKMNKELADQFYYLLKHVLKQNGIAYEKTYSIFAPPFHSADVPEVRNKPKRQKKKNANALNLVH